MAANVVAVRPRAVVDSVIVAPVSCGFGFRTRLCRSPQRSRPMKPSVPYVRVLDGGLGSELGKKGLLQTKDSLWSARALVDNYQAIVDVHASYIESGSEVIATCSYQANVDNLQAHLGVSPSEAERLIARSCEAAFEARRKQRPDRPNVLIAGSVGPYGAAKADLSEYTGAYADAMSVEEFVNWHRPRVRCLVDAGVDLLAFETIPAAREALALVQLLREFPSAKAWSSFSVSKDAPLCTAKGEPLADVFKDVHRADTSGQLVAVGVNCCPPDAVKTIFEKSGPLPIPFVAYPNSGELYSPSGWLSGPKPSKPLSGYVDEWIELNVTHIGGCCRTGPADIRDVAVAVKIANARRGH